MGQQIEALLAEGDLEEAWRSLKGWYHAVEDRAPKPCYESMEKQTKERLELYRKLPPGGSNSHQLPFDIRDGLPDEQDIREVKK